MRLANNSWISLRCLVDISGQRSCSRTVRFGARSHESQNSGRNTYTILELSSKYAISWPLI